MTDAFVKPSQDFLSVARELLALEHAVKVAPDSQRVRDVYDEGWSVAFERYSQRSTDDYDAYDQLSEFVAAALQREYCETCGGLGVVPDVQYHAGADYPEPITSACPTCCARCQRSGLVERIVQVADIVVDDNDDIVSAVTVNMAEPAYCDCRFGDHRRERDVVNAARH